MTASTATLLQAQRLDVCAPGGRPLFRDLSLVLQRGDRVALVGRNGVGKSTLLHALAGTSAHERGELTCSGTRVLVPQGLEPSAEGPLASPGEVRRRRLERALAEEPDLLLLDEPTHDLDRDALDWLANALQRFHAGLILVSHNPRLLRGFRDYFVVAESGCHHFHGSFDELIAALAGEHEQNEQRYVRQLQQLVEHEKRHDHVQRRAERKKNRGRIRELDRCAPKILLNAKRGAAQKYQAKRRLIQEGRLDAARTWVRATRRALRVELALTTVLPRLPAPLEGPVAALQGVSARAANRVLFADLTLELGRQRIAVTGANGAGKSTLLELLAGRRAPEHGRASIHPARIGYIAQNAANWRLDESLLQQLIQELQLEPEAAASCMRAHGFPFALAGRPLASLSPGERLRAALICLLERPSPPELLILDEPTSHLDFLGYAALTDLLTRWTGGLVVVSHDEDFLTAIALDDRVRL